MKRTCLLLMALAATALCGARHRAAGQGVPDGPVSMEELGALAAGRIRPVETLRVACEVFQDPAPGTTGAHLGYLSRSVLVDVVGGQFFMESSVRPGGSGSDAPLRSVALSFDSEVDRAFLPDVMIGIVKRGADVHASRFSRS